MAYFLNGPHMGTVIRHPVPDRVMPSIVIFDIQTHSLEHQCPEVKNYKWRLIGWYRMLYSCTHMAYTMGIKG